MDFKVVMGSERFIQNHPYHVYTWRHCRAPAFRVETARP